MHGRLHGKQRHDLEQVILNDIAQTSRGFIESATLLDSELLGQGNLHALYVMMVPDRLQKRIGEAEIKDIHDRFLAQEVVYAKNRFLRKHGVRDPVQVAGGRQVASRSEEHKSELQSLKRNSYAVFCMTKKTPSHNTTQPNTNPRA